MIVNALLEKDRTAAVAESKRTGKRATVGRVTIIPSFDGRKLPMDERKRLFREVGGDGR